MFKKFVFPLTLLSLVFASPVSLAGPEHDTQHVIQEVQDLAELSNQSSEQQVPILIMFSQKGCAYCVVLEENYLKPMLRSGDYQDKVIIRKVRIDSYETLRDFDGSPVEADKLATNYRAYVTPTMVFLDYNGKELTRRLLGIGTEGFFANEIDQAIDHSLNRLRSVALK